MTVSCKRHLNSNLELTFINLKRRRNASKKIEKRSKSRTRTRLRTRKIHLSLYIINSASCIRRLYSNFDFQSRNKKRKKKKTE